MLKNKVAIILPDHDDAGESYAQAVMDLCHQAGADEVRIVRLADHWPDLSTGGDLVDVLHLEGGDAEAVHDALDGLTRATTPERKESESPVKRRTYTPFPVEALPEPVRSYVAGQPRHITLGRVNKRYALAVNVKVEDLVSANIHGHAPTDETVIWLKTIEDRLYEKLEAVGLIPERQRTTLGQWLDEYLAGREDDLKPSSLNKLAQVKTKLLSFFDEDTPIRSITPADAAD